MNSDDKLLLRALRGASVDRHPFWLMRQAGRYLPEYRATRADAGSFLDLCLDPERATEVTLQPIRRFGMDASILFSDILVVPFGLGQNLTFQEGEGPKLPPIRDEKGLEILTSSLDLVKLAPIYETVRRLRVKLPSETALIGFAGAPWTVATYMVEGGGSREFTHCKGWIARDPHGFQILIDRITIATIAHLSAQIDAGCEVVQLFDSWAGALEGDAFQKWVIEPTIKIVHALKTRYPKIPIIGFPKGAGSQYLEYVRNTKVDAVSIDTDMPLNFARDVLQPIVPVQGNLDPLLLVAGGPAMERRVKEIIDTLGKGPFVFNLGHGIVPQTPPEHVAKIAEIIKSTPVKK